jgi:hypothetical protein
VWNRVDSETKKEYGEKYFKNCKLESRHDILISDYDYCSHLVVASRASRLSHCSSNLDLVVDAYVHAITARFPKIRYWVGWDAILFYIPLATLPTFLQDFVIDFQRRDRDRPRAAIEHH